MKYVKPPNNSLAWRRSIVCKQCLALYSFRTFILMVRRSTTNKGSRLIDLVTASEGVRTSAHCRQRHMFHDIQIKHTRFQTNILLSLSRPLGWVVILSHKRRIALIVGVKISTYLPLTKASGSKNLGNLPNGIERFYFEPTVCPSSLVKFCI